MSCPKNIVTRKLLFFKCKSEGEHDFEIDLITTFMRFDNDFIIKKHCKLCGAPSQESFIKFEEMIRRGYTQDQLNEISKSYFGKSLIELKKQLSPMPVDRANN